MVSVRTVLVIRSSRSPLLVKLHLMRLVRWNPMAVETLLSQSTMKAVGCGCNKLEVLATNLSTGVLKAMALTSKSLEHWKAMPHSDRITQKRLSGLMHFRQILQQTVPGTASMSRAVPDMRCLTQHIELHQGLRSMLA